MEKSWAKVESVRAVILPAASFYWSVMDNKTTSRWYKRGAVEIKENMDLGVYGDCWIDAGGTDKVNNEI